MGSVWDAGRSQPGPLSDALGLLGYAPPVLLSCVSMMDLRPLRSTARWKAGLVVVLWDISTPPFARYMLPFHLVVEPGIFERTWFVVVTTAFTR